MKKLIDFFNNYDIFLPFDMEYTLPNNMRLYTVDQDIVSTRIKAPSDNGCPGYLSTQKKCNSEE